MDLHVDPIIHTTSLGGGKGFVSFFFFFFFFFFFLQIGLELWLPWQHKCLNGETIRKIFFSETTRPTALIFGMWKWLRVLYMKKYDSRAYSVPARGLYTIIFKHCLLVYVDERLQDHWSSGYEI